jgi:radical SAM protein with 4Fe4S-binding SPASM domain
MDHQCGAGTGLVALASDGTFAPCHRFVFYDRGPAGPRYCMGELGSGLDPAASQDFDALRIEDLAGAAGPCVECDSFDLCGFGCVAISFATTGSLTRIPPWVCALMRAQIEACRSVHAALEGDPRLALYSGVSLNETLAGVARAMGARASELLDERGSDWTWQRSI